MSCTRCRSYAINHHLHGRDGSDGDLCDVCYWRKRAESYGWQPIETAPKDQRILVWTGVEMYCAHWAKNIFTDDEAWIVAQWGDNRDQALVRPTHWMPLPEQPEKP